MCLTIHNLCLLIITYCNKFGNNLKIIYIFKKVLPIIESNGQSDYEKLLVTYLHTKHTVYVINQIEVNHKSTIHNIPKIIFKTSFRHKGICSVSISSLRNSIDMGRIKITKGLKRRKPVFKKSPAKESLEKTNKEKL